MLLQLMLGVMWIGVQNFMAINPIVWGIISLKPTDDSLMTVFSIPPMWTMNTCTRNSHNPSDSCWDKSVWTEWWTNKPTSPFTNRSTGICEATQASPLFFLNTKFQLVRLIKKKKIHRKGDGKEMKTDSQSEVWPGFMDGYGWPETARCSES